MIEKGEEIERKAEAELQLAKFLADQVKNAATYFGYPEVPENNDLSILGISGTLKCIPKISKRKC